MLTKIISSLLDQNTTKELFNTYKLLAGVAEELYEKIYETRSPAEQVQNSKLALEFLEKANNAHGSYWRSRVKEAANDSDDRKRFTLALNHGASDLLVKMSACHLGTGKLDLFVNDLVAALNSLPLCPDEFFIINEIHGLSSKIDKAIHSFENGNPSDIPPRTYDAYLAIQLTIYHFLSLFSGTAIIFSFIKEKLELTKDTDITFQESVYGHCDYIRGFIMDFDKGQPSFLVRDHASQLEQLFNLFVIYNMVNKLKEAIQLLQFINARFNDHPDKDAQQFFQKKISPIIKQLGL